MPEGMFRNKESEAPMIVVRLIKIVIITFVIIVWILTLITIEIVVALEIIVKRMLVFSTKP